MRKEQEKNMEKTKKNEQDIEWGSKNNEGKRKKEKG